MDRPHRAPLGVGAGDETVTRRRSARRIDIRGKFDEIGRHRSPASEAQRRRRSRPHPTSTRLPEGSMPKTPRLWIAIAAALALGGGLTPGVLAQTKFVVGNAGGSSADAERKVFYGPFATANKITIQEESFNQERAKVRSQVETGNLLRDIVRT